MDFIWTNSKLSVLLVSEILNFTQTQTKQSIAISKALRKFVDAIIDPIECGRREEKKTGCKRESQRKKIVY